VNFRVIPRRPRTDEDVVSGVCIAGSRIVTVTIGNAKLAWAFCVDTPQKERIALQLPREFVS
jgi:hypothetical protein